MSDSSLTITLSGTSSILETRFFPPIELSAENHYVLGLVELLTFNAIPNIDTGSNTFYIDGIDPIVVPTGSYEIESLEKYLIEKISSKEIELSIKANNNTLKSIITCNRKVNFTPSDSIAKLLGFQPQVLEANKTHISDLPVSILKVNSLRIECNITSGAYINGQKVHTIHEFFPAVPPGYKIIEVPTEVIYLPLSVKSIDYLQLRIVDQDGDQVNFRGEVITIRLHIKSVK